MKPLVKLEQREQNEMDLNSKVSLIKQPYTVHLDPKIKNEIISLQLKGFPDMKYGQSHNPILDRFSLV